MKLFGLPIPFTGNREEKAIGRPMPSRGGWLPIIRDHYPGAWQRNQEIELDSVLTHSTVYACKTLIENDIAKLGFGLMAEDESGIWRRVDNPAFSPVLRKPNAYQSRLQFFQAWMNSKLTWGNTYVLKERDSRGVVIGLYVLNPQLVRPLVSDEGEVFYELRRDNLTGLTEETVTVPATEIIHDRMNTIWHPLVGISPIAAAGLAAMQGLHIQSNSAQFFGNGARPSGVLVAPAEISQQTADEIKDYWQREFSGKNTGRIAVLGDGMTYQPMTMTAVDSQLIEQLRLTAETVCSSFHVPPFKVGIGALPTYNNIQVLNIDYFSKCLQIHIRAIQDCINDALKLGRRFGNRYGVRFNLDDLLLMDTATLVSTYAEATMRGMAPNEFRAKLGLPPVPGGDEPFLQEQMWPIRQLADRPMAETPDDPRPDLPAPDEAPESSEAEERAWRAEFLLELQKGLAA